MMHSCLLRTAAPCSPSLSLSTHYATIAGHKSRITDECVGCPYATPGSQTRAQAKTGPQAKARPHSTWEESAPAGYPSCSGGGGAPADVRAVTRDGAAVHSSSSAPPPARALPMQASIPDGPLCHHQCKDKATCRCVCTSNHPHHLRTVQQVVAG